MFQTEKYLNGLKKIDKKLEQNKRVLVSVFFFLLDSAITFFYVAKFSEFLSWNTLYIIQCNLYLFSTKNLHDIFLLITI